MPLNKTTLSKFFRVSLLSSLVTLCSLGYGRESDRDIVLVAATEQSIRQLSSLELRKLFLGLPVTLEDSQLVPVVYYPNEEVRSIFLKSIVGMTSRSYDRKVLQVRLDLGADVILTAEDINELASHVSSTSNAVSFMTYADAKKYELNIVQTLWQSAD